MNEKPVFSKIFYVQRCRQFAIPKEKISVFKQKRIRIPVNGSKCFLLGEPIMSQPYNSNRKQICSFQLTGRRRILLASIGCRRDWMIILSSSRSCGPLNTFQKEKKDNYLTQAMFKQYRMAFAPHETIPDGVLVPIWMFFSFENLRATWFQTLSGYYLWPNIGRVSPRREQTKSQKCGHIN